ncbi:phosphoserine transaminase [Aspergillus tubingensis]|uniref:Phosphoserine transaminase n=1 Tax=Aspergillus tubingensis TaxID=5068 RepID=A0A9W6AS50_ASPTU|nr:phosphoserine transaminase [Aspergillus tubingensis]GLA69783.1 phosphoserine transaminase [Aspergillus tubingensis]GLA86032.1 phosphoserine transaminase [Aspergillus tubingensis]
MSDSDTALLPWESVNDAFFGSHYDSTAPQITSLLSACSYPVPQQIRQPQRRQQDVQLPLLGGIIPENQSLLYNNDTQPTQPPVKSLKRTRNEVEKSGSSALTKRGRPRKVAQDTADEDPEERRRRQIRLAQRAYRSRKEANLSSLKGRISELEGIVEKMSTSVLSLSDELVRSGALASHAGLTEHLRDTVQTCLTLAREASNDSPQEVTTISPPQTDDGLPDFLPHEQHSQTAQIVELDESVSSILEPNLHLELRESPITWSKKIPRFFESSETAEMDLTVMDRKRIASYFQAALNEKESRKYFAEWDEVPFFSLGGAGTHYSRSSLRSKAADRPFRPGVRWVSVRSVSHFPQHIQTKLQGDWFDMGDLEGYLREHDVHLLTYPPMDPARHCLKGTAINAARFIQGMVPFRSLLLDSQYSLIGSTIRKCNMSWVDAGVQPP